MVLRRILVSSLVALCLGCASGDVKSGSASPTGSVKVISQDQIGARAYEILSVLEESEMTAEASPASTRGLLTSRLQRQASKLGADAVVVTCRSAERSMFCRGIAIKWRPDSGAEVTPSPSE